MIRHITNTVEGAVTVFYSELLLRAMFSATMARYTIYGKGRYVTPPLLDFIITDNGQRIEFTCQEKSDIGMTLPREGKQL